MNFQTKYDKIMKDEFIKYYEKIRKDLMIRLSTSDYVKTNAKDFIRTINRYPIEIKHAMSKVLQDSQDIRTFIVDIDPTYEIFFIDSADISLKDNSFHPGDAIVIWEDIETDEKKFRTAFIILGRNNPAYKDENTQHIIDHEITHVMMDYFQYSKRWEDGFLQNLSNDENEFFADFIPIYYLKDKDDLLSKYIDYATKWFKPEVVEKHREFIKQIVLYYNLEGNYPT